MLSTLVIAWAITSTAAACLFGRQAIKYKTQMLLAKSEIHQISDRLYEAVEGDITDQDVDIYLQNHGLMHDWTRKASSKVEWKINLRLFSDSLRSDMCRRCGLIRRYWIHGTGRDQYPKIAGCFRNGVRIVGDGSNVKCCYSHNIPPPKVRLFSYIKLPKMLTDRIAGPI